MRAPANIYALSPGQMSAGIARESTGVDTDLCTVVGVGCIQFCVLCCGRESHGTSWNTSSLSLSHSHFFSLSFSHKRPQRLTHKKLNHMIALDERKPTLRSSAVLPGPFDWIFQSNFLAALSIAFRSYPNRTQHTTRKKNEFLSGKLIEIDAEWDSEHRRANDSPSSN